MTTTDAENASKRAELMTRAQWAIFEIEQLYWEFDKLSDPTEEEQRMKSRLWSGYLETSDG